MKTTIHHMIAGIALTAVSGLAFAPAAFAGAKLTAQVSVINNVSGFGSVGSARAAGDSSQYIGCSIDTTTTTQIGTCTAANQFGTTVTCTTSTPALLDAIGTITPMSYILFHLNGTSCDRIQVTNDSRYLPSQP